MRRVIPALLVVGGILLVPYLIGRLNMALADGDQGPFDPEPFPGQVSVEATGGMDDDDLGPDDSTYAVADEDRGEAEDGDRGERRRPRHHHRPPHHGGHGYHDGPPHHDRHGHRGPPGPPPGHHHAMRRLDDIIDRLAKIEAKLGIEDPAPVRRERRPRPEGWDEGRPGAGSDRPERRGPPEEMRRAWEERVEEGRRRMEDARRRFRDMEERVKKLEAEIERLKAEKTGP